MVFGLTPIREEEMLVNGKQKPEISEARDFRAFQKKQRKSRTVPRTGAFKRQGLLLRLFFKVLVQF